MITNHVVKLIFWILSKIPLKNPELLVGVWIVETTGELFDVAMKMQSDPKTKDLILNQMRKIQEKHTYINRVNDIITAAEI